MSAATDPLADPQAFERMCAGKEQYPSESAAGAAIEAYRKNGLLKRAATLIVYPCNFGEHWHFGH